MELNAVKTDSGFGYDFAEQIARAGNFIFKHGRLLERKLYGYFFGQGSLQSCINALLAYQNPDGGFGNGIEPDLLCPDSTAIGAEFAMHVMEFLELQDSDIADVLIDWIMSHQDENGCIPHPPQNMFKYPHQPWWRNADPERILMLAGILKKWGVDDSAFFRRVRTFYRSTSLPPLDRYYSYPHFVYLKYCSEDEEDRANLDTLTNRLPAFLIAHANHFPLLSRGWMYAREYVSKETWDTQAAYFMNALQEDGGVKTPYPDLPWWRPIWTLNGLILLNR